MALPFVAPLLGFVSKPLVKYLGGALLVGIIIWVAVAKFNNWKDSIREEGRLAGRAEVEAQVREIVANNNRVNRTVEQQVDSALNQFTGRLTEQLDRIRGESTTYYRTIERQIAGNPILTNPQCNTPQETLDARNGIRRLGPEGRSTPLVSEGTTNPDGSVTIPLPPAQ